MATPLTADAFLARALSWDIPLVLHEGWRTRNRNSGRLWGPVHGVMLHHTVTKGVRPTLRIVKDVGQGPAVPPPLYSGVVDKEGLLHMIGWGRVNHAGMGDDDVLQAVIGERTLPADNEANTDGNRYFYGLAGINFGDGTDPWPAAQLHTLAEAAAAICKLHGWSERSVIGHREWQPGKVDPLGPAGNLMPSLRAMVREML
jgi:hypothetical protein